LQLNGKRRSRINNVLKTIDKTILIFVSSRKADIWYSVACGLLIGEAKVEIS